MEPTLNEDGLVILGEVDEYTAAMLSEAAKASPYITTKIIKRDGKFYRARTPEDQEDYKQRQAEAKESQEEDDTKEYSKVESSDRYKDTEEDIEPLLPLGDNLKEIAPPTPSYPPRIELSRGPCLSPRNAERDCVLVWAEKEHRAGRAPGEILESYLDITKNVPRGLALSPKQATIVIIDRACKGRGVTGKDEFDCEVHDHARPERVSPVLIRRDGELHLVRNRILRGHLVIVGGDPSTGKTTYTWQVAAALSRGGNFAGETLHEGRVIIFCAEPKNEEQYERFMRGIKTNPDNIRMVWRADEDVNIRTLDRLTQIIADFGPDLIVFDPIEVYLGLGKGDGGQNDVVMQAGQPLYRIAERTNAAILGTRFINKKGKLAGCPAFEGLCSRITHLEFDRSYRYQHLDPALGPRIIRDRHDKIRIGCGEPIEQDLYWLPENEGYHIKPVNGGYGRRKSVQVGNVLRRLFPYRDYHEVKWFEIWGGCREIRVSERTIRRVMSTHGVTALDQGRAAKKGDVRYVREYLLDAKQGQGFGNE